MVVQFALARHRHRYEVNPDLVNDIEKAGLNLIGRDETGKRMEIAELLRSVHPFYLGCQYHPEFKSRPLAPSPPFYGLLLAATGQLDGWMESRSSKKRKLAFVVRALGDPNLLAEGAFS